MFFIIFIDVGILYVVGRHIKLVCSFLWFFICFVVDLLLLVLKSLGIDVGLW